MKKREREILKIILNNKSIIIDKIADEVGVSEKTIRNNLKSHEIESFMEENSLTLTKVRGRGISIIGDESDISKALMNLAHSKDSVRSILFSKKSQYLLFVLLFSVEEISITKMEHKLYCSKSIIYEILKNLKVYLANYDIELVSDCNNYYVRGSEKRIRFLMFICILDLKEKINNFNSKDFINLFEVIGFSDEYIRSEYNYAVEFTSNLETIFNVLLVEESFEYLVIKSFINSLRIKKNQPVKLSKQIKQKIIGFDKNIEIEKMENSFFKIYGKKLSQDESYYVIGQMSTFQTYSESDNFFVFQETKLQVNEIIKKLDKALYKEYSYSIGKSRRNFLEKFLIHLSNSNLFEDYVHTGNKFKISKNKNKFKYIKLLFSNLIEEQLRIKLKSDEINSLDVVVEYLLLDIEQPLNVAIIFDGSYEEIRLFTKLIENNIKNIVVKEVFSSRKKININENIDVLISNYPLENSNEIYTIYVTNDIDDEVLKYINKSIEKFVNKVP